MLSAWRITKPEDLEIIFAWTNHQRRLQPGEDRAAPLQASAQQPARQLQTSALERLAATYTWRSWQNISLDVETAKVELQDMVGVGRSILSVANVTTPSNTLTQLNCSTNMAFQLGSLPTSLHECECDAGYQPQSAAECAACQEGFYKDSVVAPLFCRYVVAGFVCVMLVCLMFSSHCQHISGERRVIEKSSSVVSCYLPKDCCCRSPPAPASAAICPCGRLCCCCCCWPAG